jgi:hypothetical protein
MDKKEFCVSGFKVTIIQKPAFEVIGFSKFVHLDGVSIAKFLDELKRNGQYNKLEKTLDVPQQIWVCLSGNEGQPDADCRCTVCVEKTDENNFSQFTENELYRINVTESQWADFEINKNQTSTEFHKIGNYGMLKQIGYEFNNKVGLHFDNEHEEYLGGGMHFITPVIPIKNV